MKIVVIGYSGAGKTFLTDELGKRLNCPVMHIDDLLFTSGFDSRDSAAAAESVERVLQENTSWVLDGYKDIFTKRKWLESADYIVFLDFNRITCFWRVLKRTFRRFAKDVDNQNHTEARKMDAESADAKAADTESKGTEPTDAKSAGTVWQLSKILRSFRWILWDERRLQDGKYYSDVGKIFPEKFIVLQNQKAVDQFTSRCCQGN